MKSRHGKKKTVARSHAERPVKTRGGQGRGVCVHVQAQGGQMAVAHERTPHPPPKSAPTPHEPAHAHRQAHPQTDRRAKTEGETDRQTKRKTTNQNSGRVQSVGNEKTQTHAHTQTHTHHDRHTCKPNITILVLVWVPSHFAPPPLSPLPARLSAIRVWSSQLPTVATCPLVSHPLPTHSPLADVYSPPTPLPALALSLFARLSAASSMSME